MAIRHTLFAVAIAASLSGCATIMGSPTQTLPIASTPSDAKVVITDEAGTEVFAGQTPTSVTLNKSTGRYWGGKSFKVTISKPGFKTQTVVFKADDWRDGGDPRMPIDAAPKKSVLSRSVTLEPDPNAKKPDKKGK